MTNLFRFVLIGLVLGLYTEVQFKLIAGIMPSTFIVTVFVYPVIVTLSYVGRRLIDRLILSTWKGDILHYMAAGLGGLGIEWVLLGNGPESNAFQLGMFAMWMTFCFGPRILILISMVPSWFYWKQVEQEHVRAALPWRRPPRWLNGAR